MQFVVDRQDAQVWLRNAFRLKVAPELFATVGGYRRGRGMNTINEVSKKSGAVQLHLSEEAGERFLALPLGVAYQLDRLASSVAAASLDE